MSRTEYVQIRASEQERADVDRYAHALGLTRAQATRQLVLMGLRMAGANRIVTQFGEVYGDPEAIVAAYRRLTY